MTSDATEPLFTEFVNHLFTVLADADRTSKVMECPIPVAIHEDEPANISDAYFTHIAQKEAEKAENSDRVEDEYTTIADRYGAKHYTGIYSIFHDLKLASIILIAQQTIGSPAYQDVDFFYKVSVELLMREAHRLGVSVRELSARRNAQALAEKPSQFETFLAKEFYRISTAFTAANGEAFVVTSSLNLPLFSSLNRKSVLDERTIDLPDPFQPVQIIAQSSTAAPVSLGVVLPHSSKILAPTIPPTEIMPRFFHPNWFSLPIATWLENRESDTSFAPTVDETGAVICNETKTSVWLEQMGTKELREIRAAYDANIVKMREQEARKLAGEDIEETEIKAKEDIDEGEEGGEINEAEKEINETGEEINETAVKEDIKATDSAEISDAPKPITNGKFTEPAEDVEMNDADPSQNPEASGSEPAEDIDDGPGPEINMVNLFEWNPANTIDADEIEAAENHTEQELASRLLIDLNKLRQKRSLRSTPGSVVPPSAKERDIYFKVRRLLASLVGELSGPELLGLEVSKTIPVLQTNYCGTLPAPVPIQSKSRYTKTKKTTRR
ncbi:hypothetical protein BABINDRAFT_159731 [Babjeviella inositovora NRRL Y-12698]|uniref:Bromo domain-containing protein n=1 Tax=Babjeviella inositovora NRRL Y-12698 TaxID=984486 RepID=A0A1E3QUV3_9ASCO|nr:uncharacterized protein BABINDRAFT_159731 [Babjeviella inositovora NRRL Y-12698]ODQ81438.1 hypothetical protein BABINDRAFT_159731 [Babjeviella inositovora NRRL Y-12698]